MEPQITPFKGYRYNAAIAGDTASLLAPPYDVISPDKQDKLYKKSDFNIVRLILGKTSPEDAQDDSRYTRASATLAGWVKKGALKQDEQPAIYVYSQTYTVAGHIKTRTGFIARKRLEDFGGSVLAHEKTFSGPKADRLNLTRACKFNFSQIFGLYTDAQKVTDGLMARAMKGPPVIDVKLGNKEGENGERHALWPVTDPEWIKSLVDAMNDRTIFIADGHHRYETAVNFMKENTNEKGECPQDMKYVMMYFTNTESDGLTILPTHRALQNISGFDMDEFIKKISGDFEVEPITSMNGNRNDDAEKLLAEKMKDAGCVAFGVYTGGGKYTLLKYKQAPEGGPLDKLDVGILHKRLFEKTLELGEEEQTDQSHIAYMKDAADAARRVDEGRSQLAFFLNPTPVELLREVASAGLKMPQKSTYFYPKLITGLVINPLF
ncbi:MAG: DUF1015 domain-containing protein [Nitrospinota bacterium]